MGEWVEHDGGDCPVSHDVWIDSIQYRSGDTAKAECRASVLSWRNDPWSPMVDIVAYLPEAIQSTDQSASEGEE